MNASPMQRVIRVSLWTLVWLAAIDVAINLAVDPARPWGDRITGLSRYFNHGRSIEGKLVEALGPRADRPHSVVRAGWIDPEEYRRLPDKPAEGRDLLVAVYGQSFAFNAAGAVGQIDGRITLRMIGGPAAPLSHSLAAHRADAPLRRADVVLVGVLASSLAKSESISGLSWTFESPAPFTFPKYELRAGALLEERPVLQTEAQFRAALRERGEAWDQFKAQLEKNDRGFDRVAFEASVLDRSAIVRLLRRAWVAHHQAYPTNADDPAADHFDPARIALAHAMLRSMKQTADRANERLVVVLLHDRGHRDSLHRALAPELERLGIAHVSTHTLFSSADPRMFVADGHYTEAANTRLARAIHQVIRGRDMPPLARAAAGPMSP